MDLTVRGRPHTPKIGAESTTLLLLLRTERKQDPESHAGAYDASVNQAPRLPPPPPPNIHYMEDEFVGFTFSPYIHTYICIYTMYR